MRAQVGATRTPQVGRTLTQPAQRGEPGPHLLEVGKPVGVRATCIRRAVDRADAGAQHQVGDDSGFEQGTQRADLGGPEHSAAAENERGARGWCSHDIDTTDQAIRPNVRWIPLAVNRTVRHRTPRAVFAKSLRSGTGGWHYPRGSIDRRAHRGARRLKGTRG